MTQLSIPKLSEVPQTPFYLYSEENLEINWSELNAHLDKDIHVHFALKSNHNPRVIQFFADKGLGFDIVSGGELSFLQSLNVASDKIVFSGVGKTEIELNAAIESELGLINVESEFELLKIIKIAEQKAKKVKVGLRLNPDVDAKTHPYIATGLKAHKFGMSFDQAKSLIEKYICPSKSVLLTGLSMHIGSQILDLSSIKEAGEKVLAFAKSLSSAETQDLSVLDLGGGLGIFYDKPLQCSDFEQYGKILQQLLMDWKGLVGESAVVDLELGRSLVANAGFLFTRVLGTKENSGTDFVVVDASMTELMRPALYQAKHEIFQHKKRSEPTKTYDVVGPVCESSDVIAKDKKLTPLSEGDVLMIASGGAYGYVLSNTYNMRPLPPEYWLGRDGTLKLVRKALKWADLDLATRV